MRGHVACRLCEANGLAECTVLHGIENVAIRDAFHFAASRLGVSVLAESSKHIHWCGSFFGRTDLSAKVVHLVRHPCGFVESHGRRLPKLSPDDLLAMWERENREISKLAARAQYMMISYDDLTAAPNIHFPRLCEFIGGTWEPGAIEYWRFPHHGLGANGAAAPYLRGRPNAHLTTGDDAFYADIENRPTAPDLRWTIRLPAEFIQRAINHPYAIELEEVLGKKWAGHDQPVR
ncbi:MAG: sulfotransferase [Planctomycetota bacterium]